MLAGLTDFNKEIKYMASMELTIFGVFMFGIIHIAMFMSFPKFFKYTIAYIPAFAIIVDFMISGLIASFTGDGNAVGFMNMGGTVVFGAWVFWYKAYHKLTVQNKKWLFFNIPIIYAENPRETWYV